MAIVLAVSAAGMSVPCSTPYGFHTPPVVRKQAVIRRVRSVQKFLEGRWPWVSQRLQKAISKVGVLENRGQLIDVRFSASRCLSWTSHCCKRVHERSPYPPDPRCTSGSDGGCAFTFSAQTSPLRARPACTSTRPTDPSLDPDYVDDWTSIT